MVSWLRSFCLQWKHYSNEFDADDAVAFQTRLHAIKGSSNPDEALVRLFRDTTDKPGVFLIAESEAKRRSGSEPNLKPTFEVVPFHHPMVASLGARVIGLTSMKADAVLKGVELQALTDGLIPTKKATSKVWKEKWIPSLTRLIEDESAIDKPAVQDQGDSVFSIRDLVDWPRLTFIPVHLLVMMFDKEGSDEDDESGEGADLDLDEGDPDELLEKLIHGLRLMRLEQSQLYEEAVSMATYPAAFLWTISKRLNEGTEMVAVDPDRNTIQHGIACNQELLYDERQWQVLREGKERAREYEGSDGESEAARVLESIERENRRGVGYVGIQTSPTRKQGAQENDGYDDESVVMERVTRPRLGHGSKSRCPPGKPTQRPRKESPGEYQDPSQGRESSKGSGPARDSEWSEAFVQGFNAANQSLTGAGRSPNHVAQSNQATLDKRESKEKATSKWLPSWVYLLRALSTDQGWQTKGFPATTSAFDQLNEMKLFQATMLVRSAARQQKWPGGMLKSGVAEFLKRGLLADDIDVEPSGFSVLFFYGGSYVEKDGEAFSRQQLRESYGDAGLSEEMMTAFNKRDIFIPQNTYEAADQIQCTISFLNWVCGEENIAISGYQVGLKILQSHKRAFDAESSRTRSFLVNYLYMLDRTFQDFCTRMLEFEFDGAPAQAAKDRGLHRLMERNISEAMRPWMVNRIVPNFSAPVSLQSKASSEGVVSLADSTSGSSAGDSQGKSAKARGRRNGKGNDTKNLELDRLPQNEYVREWQLPPGKHFSDFFGANHPGRTKDLPKFPHHSNGRMEPMCLRHQLSGCPRGSRCSFTHVRPSEMSKQDRDAITSHLQEIYKRDQK